MTTFSLTIAVPMLHSWPPPREWCQTCKTFTDGLHVHWHGAIYSDDPEEVSRCLGNTIEAARRRWPLAEVTVAA